MFHFQLSAKIPLNGKTSFAASILLSLLCHYCSINAVLELTVLKDYCYHNYVIMLTVGRITITAIRINMHDTFS